MTIEQRINELSTRRMRERRNNNIHMTNINSGMRLTSIRHLTRSINNAGNKVLRNTKNIVPVG